MWYEWDLRTKIVMVSMGVVLSVVALITILTIRMSRQAIEEDLRTSGLSLARELAASRRFLGPEPGDSRRRAR